MPLESIVRATSNARRSFGCVLLLTLVGCGQVTPAPFSTNPREGASAKEVPTLARAQDAGDTWTYRGTFVQTQGKMQRFSLTQRVTSASGTFDGRPATTYRGDEDPSGNREPSLSYQAAVVQRKSAVTTGVDVARVASALETSDGVRERALYDPDNGTFDRLPEVPQARWTNGAALRETVVDRAAGSSASDVYRADGSYDESGVPVAGRIAIAQTHPDGNAVYQWPFDGAGVNSTLTVLPPQTSITMYISDAAALPFPTTIRVRIHDWYPRNPPSLASDELIDQGVAAVPSDCGVAKRFSGDAVELVERRTRLDVIYGQRETTQRTTWNRARFGVVCMKISDVLKSYYDFTTLKFAGTPLSVTTTSETLGLQSMSGTDGATIVAAPLEARFDAWQASLHAEDVLAIYRSLRLASKHK